jgi:hypothetical protein
MLEALPALWIAILESADTSVTLGARRDYNCGPCERVTRHVLIYREVRFAEGMQREHWACEICRRKAMLCPSPAQGQSRIV